MTNTKETQKSVTNWAEETFGAVTDQKILVQRATLEMDELLEAVTNKDTVEIGKETADVIILLMRLLENHNLDLSTEVTKKMQENRSRKWLPKGDGTGKHIKS